jgi:hypothetical protein
MLRAALIATTVLILGSAGAGLTGAQCVGDCDGNGAVAVREIVAGVAVALARIPIDGCAAMDADADLDVSISELTLAVGFALRGCPSAATPTAPPTRCGDPAVAAQFGRCVRSDNQADCESAGGTWGPYPFSGIDGCFCSTGQDGCPCRTADDCLSFCIAPFPPPGQSDLCAGVEIGTCSELSPVAGCFCTPWEQGFVALCSDP